MHSSIDANSGRGRWHARLCAVGWACLSVWGLGLGGCVISESSQYAHKMNAIMPADTAPSVDVAFAFGLGGSDAESNQPPPAVAIVNE